MKVNKGQCDSKNYHNSNRSLQSGETELGRQISAVVGQAARYSRDT